MFSSFFSWKKQLFTVLALAARANAQQTFWQDSYRLGFDYNPISGIGPEEWDLVDISDSEYQKYADFHPIFNLGIASNECSEESQPSPLELTPDSPCLDTAEMETRQEDSTDCTRTDLTFEVTPHALRAYYPETDEVCVRPTIELDGFPSPFILVWMELHARSEHVVDGRRFDAELQMVHMGTGMNDDQIATVSVLIVASAAKDNAEFQFLLDGWQSAANAEQRACEGASRRLRERMLNKMKSTPPKVAVEKHHSARGITKQVERRDQFVCKADKFGNGCDPFGPRKRMYPYNLWPSIWYFGYSGSLTAPPCSSIVNWRVIDEPMLVSRRQLKQLALLLRSSRSEECESDTGVGLTGENFRPLQVKTDSQSISHCTIDDFSYTLYLPAQQ